MKTGLAQTRAVRGDIQANIANHLRLIEQAIALGAESVFFPELSLTAYEPELAKALATTPDDARFEVFQQLSDANGITIGVGMPIRKGMGIEISMLIFQPEKPLLTYAKQQLHTDELPYFIAGSEQAILWPDGLRVAPAICYESLQPDHARNAHQLGAGVYLASVAKSRAGVDKAMVHYPAIARQYQMPVLMVNGIGYCDTFESAGCSGAWNANGELVARLGSEDEGVLVVEVP